MSLNKYACHITHLCPTAVLLKPTYRPNITAQIHHKSINSNIYSPHYCKICATNKYIPLIPHAKITCQVLVGEVCQYIFHVCTEWYQPCDQECCTQMTIQMTMWMVTKTMTSQPNYISWVGHWLNQPKNQYFQEHHTLIKWEL